MHAIISEFTVTKIPNSKKHSNQKVPYHMAKSKAQTHQTHGKFLITWQNLKLKYITQMESSLSHGKI